MRGLALTLVLLAGACTIDDLQHENRFCSVNNPCAEGFECRQGKCTASGTERDGPPPTPDGRTDEGIADRGSADRSLDAPVTDGWKPDLPLAPDVACPPGLTLCGGACVDTQISFDHCGGCGKPCTPEISDRCEDGKCHCGHLKPLCLQGLTCYKGACACVTGPSSMCQGCCLNDQCQAGTSITACGVGGVACKSCPTSECKNTSCPGGTCLYSNKTNGTSCVSALKKGKCFNGNCCTGCWSAVKGACYSGTSDTYCGSHGNNCAQCTAPNTCKSQVCAP